MAIYEVTAPAAVIALTTGTESYLYRGARFDSDAVKETRLEHLEGLGLVKKADESAEAVEDSSGEEDQKSTKTK